MVSQKRYWEQVMILALLDLLASDNRSIVGKVDCAASQRQKQDCTRKAVAFLGPTGLQQFFHSWKGVSLAVETGNGLLICRVGEYVS